MERMKSNCRKAAMETRQQHIQVDLGDLMAFDPHHSFPSIPFSKTGVCVLCNLKPENMWSTKSEWFLLLRTAATPQCLKIRIFKVVPQNL